MLYLRPTLHDRHRFYASTAKKKAKFSSTKFKLFADIDDYPLSFLLSGFQVEVLYYASLECVNPDAALQKLDKSVMGLVKRGIVTKGADGVHLTDLGKALFESAKAQKKPKLLPPEAYEQL